MFLLVPRFIPSLFAIVFLLLTIVAGFTWLLYVPKTRKVAGHQTMLLIWTIASFVNGLVPCLQYFLDPPTSNTQVFTTIILVQGLSLLSLLLGNYLWIRLNNKLTPEERQPTYSFNEGSITALKTLWPIITASILAFVYLETAYTKQSFAFINPWAGKSGGLYHAGHALGFVPGLLDFCILLLALEPFFKVKRFLIILFSGCFIYFTLWEGVRYRLFVLVLCWAILYLPYYWTSLRNKISISVGMVFIVLCFQLWSANRWAIANKQYQYPTISLFANGSNPFLEFSQTAAAVKTLQFCIDNKLGPDNGTSSIGFILIRLTPKPIFNALGLLSPDVKGQMQKPYPPLLTRLIQATTNGYYYKGAPAYSAIHELFFSFGWWTCLIWGLIGWAIGWVSTLLGQYRALQHAFWAIAIVWWYQWLTRGYLPQQVELAIWLILPLLLLLKVGPFLNWVLNLFLARTAKENSN